MWRTQAIRTLAAVAALASGVLLTGCADDVGNVGAEHPCVSNSGEVLHADIDGDGAADTVTDPGRDSSRTRVAFGGGETREPGSALAPERLDSAATFGDFDGDGHLDLALAAGMPDAVDDPSSDAEEVHEVVWGPLGKDLKGKGTSQIALRGNLFILGLRASDADHDRTAELSVFQSQGDGQVARFAVKFDGRRADARGEGDNRYDLAHWAKWYKPGWADFGACDS